MALINFHGENSTRKQIAKRKACRRPSLLTASAEQRCAIYTVYCTLSTVPDGVAGLFVYVSTGQQAIHFLTKCHNWWAFCFLRVTIPQQWRAVKAASQKQQWRAVMAYRQVASQNHNSGMPSCCITRSQQWHDVKLHYEYNNTTVA